MSMVVVGLLASLLGCSTKCADTLQHTHNTVAGIANTIPAGAAQQQQAGGTCGILS